MHHVHHEVNGVLVGRDIAGNPGQRKHCVNKSPKSSVIDLCTVRKVVTPKAAKLVLEPWRWAGPVGRLVYAFSKNYKTAAKTHGTGLYCLFVSMLLTRSTKTVEHMASTRANPAAFVTGLVKKTLKAI